jgi:hypothetical protein
VTNFPPVAPDPPDPPVSIVRLIDEVHPLISDKVEHALAATQDRRHACHWPGCGKQVPPAMWGCKAHWFALPKALRDRIWDTYEIGQEVTMTPSAEYLAAAHAVQLWIEEHGCA